MEMDFWVFLEPVLVLLVGIEVVEDHVQLAIRKDSNDAVHEVQKLDAATPLGMRRDDLSGRHFECCKQGRGAMPFVIMALAGQGAPVRQLQVALRSLQRLDRRLFVDTENNRLRWGIDIKPNHLGGFRYKRRVVALAPRFVGGKVDVVLAQEAPNILNINVFQCLGQQRTRPAGVALATPYPKAPECACSWLFRRSASCVPAAGPSTHPARVPQSAAANC